MMLGKNSTVTQMILPYKKAISSSRQGIEDVIVSMTPQLITLIAGLVTAILLARGLGPGGMGQYTLIISISGFVSVASDMGINQTAIRFASRAASVNDTQGQYAVLRWAFRIRLVLVMAAVLAAFILAPYICETIWGMTELIPLLRLSLFISIFTVIASIPIVYFQSLKRFRMNAIVSIGETSVTLAGIVVIAWINDWSLEFVIMTSIIASIVGTMAFIAIVPKDAFISIEELKKPLKTLKNLFKEPAVLQIKSLENINPNGFLLYMIISTIIVAISSRADVWLMGYYLDKSQIGVYCIAIYFTIPLSMILSSINMVIWPRASSIKSHSDVKTFLRKTFSLSIIVAICGAIYSLIIPLLMPFVFGSVYAGGVMTAQILCLGYCIAILIGPVGVIGYNLGLIRYYWSINLLQLITLVGINIILLPRVGIIGSAIAIIVNNLVGFAIFGYLILIHKKVFNQG
jgi:O-antigen/teichoic acid export membrane protein